MSDFDRLRYTLFPRLRWEKEASQHFGGKQLIFASTNMLVFVCGLQYREKNLCCFFFAIFVFFCGQFFFGCGLPRRAFCAFLRPIRNLPIMSNSYHFYDPCTATVAFFAHFRPFRGKSIEVPLHEPFTRQTEFSRSSPVKANQA
jgi:hypothetical protein